MSEVRDRSPEGFSALLQPGNIGQLHLENRLMMAALAYARAGEEGEVTEGMLDFYRARARGGVGLITIQPGFVSADSAPPRVLAVYDDRFIPGLRRLVETMHEHGAKVAIQLMHFGESLAALEALKSLTSEDMSVDMSVMIPAAMPWLVGDKPYKEITQKDIDRYVEDFSEAARRAKEAGVDAIELHACNGCLIGGFLSPALNRRTDQYGGNVENRTRFACMILGRMREKVGREFPIWVRINGSDDVEGGITPDEAVHQAVILESAGADAISISNGIERLSPLNIPCYLFPEGPFVPLAEKVKKGIKVPVITAGRISPELAEQIVRDGKADFIALGRPLMADPELPNKLREGRVEEICRCIYCNDCMRVDPGRRATCLANPFLLREAKFPPTPTKSPKKVMVAGGGLAGMQAAVILAQRGHQVSLYEREAELGGQWNIASAMPMKETYASLTDYLRRSLDKYGVPITLSTEVTREQVLEIKPDVLVVATGAVPRTLNVPGATGDHVVQANDIIKGEVEVRGKTIIIGAPFLDMEMAVWLAEQGKEVSLVSHSGLGGRQEPEERFTFRTLMRRLIELRVPLYLDTQVLGITEGSVIISLRDSMFFLPADTVVLAVGAQPENKLAQELEGIVPEVYPIGDCVEPRDAAVATNGAARLALRI